LLDSLGDGIQKFNTVCSSVLIQQKLAVLNFVGGKNIIVPSERANAPQATSMCASQGMELMNLDSLTQIDSVKDFLGDIGKLRIYLEPA